MLQLTAKECEQLRCVSIFTKKISHEYGKSGRTSGATFNYKRMSITMARWMDTLVEGRSATPRARAAYRWLYANNMTYRHYCDMHQSILIDFRSSSPTSRTTLYISTYDLLMKLPGLEAAAWPIL